MQKKAPLPRAAPPALPFPIDAPGVWLYLLQCRDDCPLLEATGWKDGLKGARQVVPSPGEFQPHSPSFRSLTTLPTSPVSSPFLPQYLFSAHNSRDRTRSQKKVEGRKEARRTLTKSSSFSDVAGRAPPESTGQRRGAAGPRGHPLSARCLVCDGLFKIGSRCPHTAHQTQKYGP